MGRNLSRRSLALTMIGLFFLLQGLSVLTEAPTPRDLAILHTAIPLEVRAMLWTGTGLVTIIWAWSRHYQWVAAVSAVIMPLERVISYLWSTLQWAIPGPPAGSGWSIVDAGRWAAIVALVIVISGWIEWDRAGKDRDDI